MIYRIKQFIWGITARINEDDKMLIDIYLDEHEKKMFYSLPTYEQAHSIRVAREVIRESKERGLYDIIVIKAALLHDIGKINTGLNIVTKSIMVIMDKLFPKFIKRLTFLDIVYAYYNHPEMALKYLNKHNEYIKYLIKNHHNYHINEDEKLVILQKADMSC